MYWPFTNGQYTSQGGTHQSAFKEHIARTIKEFFGKPFELGDIRNGLVAAIAVNVEEPVFESQTKIKLGSTTMSPNGGLSLNKFVGDFIKKEVDDLLHKEPEVVDVILKKILESEKERKEIAGITKQARERAKRANIHNRKLADCRIHLNDPKGDRQEESSIFITEGDSASGSITKSRDVNTQAVFSLRGKPLNTYGLTKKVVYENEEFNLLQAALNIEDGLEDLRYNKIIVATDADVDGSHITTLIMTFFFRYMQDLIRGGNLFIATPPLYLVKKGKTERYCWSEEERDAVVSELAQGKESSVSIQRYKGLGEMNAEQLWETTMNPETRTLRQVTIESAAEADHIFSMLMRDEVPPRREFIETHARYARIDA